MARAAPRTARSQVEHDVARRLGAADQRASLGGGLDRVGAVAEVAGDDGGLAVVADAGAARPADRDVAGLGELEQAGVVVVPADGEVAAGERDGGTGTGSAGGRENEGDLKIPLLLTICWAASGFQVLDSIRPLLGDLGNHHNNRYKSYTP